MASDTDTVQPAAEKVSVTGKWLFVAELEHVMVASRPFLFDAIAEALKPHGVTLDPVMFRKHCLKAQLDSIGDALAGQLGSAIPDAAALNRAIAEAYHAKLAAAVSANERFVELLREAKNHSAQFAAITALPDELARGVIDRAGLAGDTLKVFSLPDSEKGFPRVEAWMKVCRSLNRNPRSCVAVTSGHDPCKAALSAGLRCIALPDEYTAHHDFSGADAVIESADESDLPELLGLLL